MYILSNIPSNCMQYNILQYLDWNLQTSLNRYFMRYLLQLLHCFAEQQCETMWQVQTTIGKWFLLTFTAQSTLQRWSLGIGIFFPQECFNQISWGEGEVLFTHLCEGLLTQELGSTEMVVDVQFHFGNHLPSPKQRGTIPWFRRWFFWVQPGRCSTKKLTTHRLI